MGASESRRFTRRQFASQRFTSPAEPRDKAKVETAMLNVRGSTRRSRPSAFFALCLAVGAFLAAPLLSGGHAAAAESDSQDTQVIQSSEEASSSRPAELSTDESATATNEEDSKKTLTDYLKANNAYELSGESEQEEDENADADAAETPVPQDVQLPTADRSGVTGQTISVPKGEGTIQGMEESFSAQLSTGIATFSVPIALPQGRGKAQPSLGLSYSSAAGYGVTGVGWSIGVPFIARQTDKGIPQYDDRAGFHHEQDHFVFNGGQELVPICVVTSDLQCEGALQGLPSAAAGTLIDEAMPPWSSGWQYFRPRVEGSFLRFFWSPDHRTWRVQDKSGVTMELGVALGAGPDSSSASSSALEVNPNNTAQIYRWHLVRQFDIYGGVDAPLNQVVYRYLDDGGMKYLSDIFYTPPADGAASAALDSYAHHVRLAYESRPDPTQSYRSGWLIQQQLRLVGVDVTSKPFGQGISAARELVRRYHFTYDGNFQTSLLTSVQVEGRCGDSSQAHTTESSGLLGATNCPRLPPMTFDYSHVQGFLADGSQSVPALSGYEAFDERTLDLAESPPHSLDEVQTSLMDINSDGLPDVLVTAAGLFDGDHGAFLNGLDGRAGSFFEDHIAVVGEAGAGTIKLSNLNVVPLDADGDAVVDLLHMPLVKDYSVYSLRQQNGQWQWLGRPVSAASGLNPAVDFGNDAPHIRVIDVNFDGLVDVVRTTGTQLQTFFSLGRLPNGDGQLGQGTRTGVERSALSNEPVRMCLPWSGTPLSFDDQDTQLADMNGDGIADIVRLRRGDVRYWPGRGNGYWGTGDPHDCEPDTFENDGELLMDNSPHYSDIQGTSMRMEDVNGDGLSDLVQVRFNEVDVYLNVNGSGWTERHIIENTTESPSYANRVRLTDINGSGTPDILWGNAGRYKYLDLTGGIKPHLLIKVENGLGKTTELQYQSSAKEMLDAAAAGNPWQSTMPTVTQVVKRVIEKDNLTIAGRPPASYVTEYSYRDPVFEGRQREFRGFRQAQVKQIGDSNSPTSISSSLFLLGECEDETENGIDECSLPERWRDNPKEALKGLPIISEVFDENGTYLSTTHNRYDLRQLYTGLDGRQVRYAFQSATTTYLYDTGPFTPANAGASAPQSGDECSEAGAGCLESVRLEVTAPTIEDNGNGPEVVSSAAADRFHAVPLRSTVGTRELFSETTVDFFGNQLTSVAHGEVGEDELITQTSIPARPEGDPTGWLWRTVKSFVTGSEHGDIQRNVQLNTYDANGDPVSTSAELAGSVELARNQPELGGNAPARSPGTGAAEEILLSTTSYDEFGNPTRSQGANLRCADVSYDNAEYQYLPVTETIYTRGCTGTLPGEQPQVGQALITQASYDRGLGVITSAFNVQGQQTTIHYDGFGRLVRMYAPDPDSATPLDPEQISPSLRVSYLLPPESGPHHSYIHTEAQDGAAIAANQYLESWAIIDGFGRTVTTLSEAEPVEIDDGTSSQNVPRWIVGAMQEWDAKSAVRRKYLEFYTFSDPREFNFGQRPTTYYGRQRYDAFGRQLQTFDLDGTVTLRSVYHALSSDAWDAADLEPGPHAGTFLTTSTDGHGRSKEVIERFHEGLGIEQRITLTEYLPTGEPEIIRRRRGTTQQEVTRWFAYDTLGRMVLNVEPNTSPNYSLNTSPNDTDDHNAAYAGITAWRYRYNNAGDLVGTSDARGCGANFFYDGAGRLLGEDYFPCDDHHAQYTEPSLTTLTDLSGQANPLPADSSGTAASLGQGLDVYYLYDHYVAPQDGQVSFEQCNPAAVSNQQWWLGRLVRVDDQASTNYSVYDGRGRTECVAARVARPYDVNSQTPLPSFTQRYTPRWYGMDYDYDAADRVTSESTGARLLVGNGGQSRVETHYTGRGVVGAITSSYEMGGTDALVGQIDRTADNLVTLVRYGDLASTATTYTYDERRRVHSVLTARAPPPGGWPAEPTSDGTFQMVLQDEQYFYDIVSNPVEIRDHRIEEEWPAGAKPVTKKIAYDDLYRAKKIEYQYTAGDDDWTSPHAADIGGAEDTRRATPSPHVSFAKRILWQAYQYDWLGNNVRTSDDANGFYDRSLGEIDNGTANDGPYQLREAASVAGVSDSDSDDQAGSLSAGYDVTGNLETLFVQRNGPCLGAGTCSQSFVYQWDELGRLNAAKRWDGSTQVTNFDAAGAAADLKYVYAAGDQRVIKTATDGSGNSVHTLYVYPSLELRRAEYDGDDPGDYTLDARTEVAYLFANGVRLGRVVNDPLQTDPNPDGIGNLHVFFELGDHLGSTSVALDKETSELVERGTYQAYGGAESDYRPGKWGDFRENYRFTGKEEDVEVGLVYFGKRFYNPLLQRWVSADPLEVHRAGEADANLYAYVSGQTLKNIDPIGLYPSNPVQVAASRIVPEMHELGFSTLALFRISSKANHAGTPGGTAVATTSTNWAWDKAQKTYTPSSFDFKFKAGELSSGTNSLFHEFGHAMVAERLGSGVDPASAAKWEPLQKAAADIKLDSGASVKDLRIDAQQQVVDELLGHEFERLVSSTINHTRLLGAGVDRAKVQASFDSAKPEAQGYSALGNVVVEAGQTLPPELQQQANSMAREFLGLNAEQGGTPITGQEVVQHAEATGVIDAPRQE